MRWILFLGVFLLANPVWSATLGATNLFSITDISRDGSADGMCVWSYPLANVCTGMSSDNTGQVRNQQYPSGGSYRTDTFIEFDLDGSVGPVSQALLTFSSFVYVSGQYGESIFVNGYDAALSPSLSTFSGSYSFLGSVNNPSIDGRYYLTLDVTSFVNAQIAAGNDAGFRFRVGAANSAVNITNVGTPWTGASAYRFGDLPNQTLELVYAELPLPAGGGLFISSISLFGVFRLCRRPEACRESKLVGQRQQA